MLWLVENYWIFCGWRPVFNFAYIMLAVNLWSILLSTILVTALLYIGPEDLFMVSRKKLRYHGRWIFTKNAKNLFFLLLKVRRLINSCVSPMWLFPWRRLLSTMLVSLRSKQTRAEEKFVQEWSNGIMRNFWLFQQKWKG